MTKPTAGVAGIYRRFLDGELRIDDAAALLEEHARSGAVEVGTLSLDTLPDQQRGKAAELLNQVAAPIYRRFMADEISTDVAAKELAPFMLPHGALALNFALPDGAPSVASMSRFMELMKRVAELAEEHEAGDA